MVMLNERRRRLETIRTIFEQGEWLTAEQINSRQKRPPVSKSQPATDWMRGGLIYSVTVEGQAYFAAYQFDTACQPQPVILNILAALGAVADTWKIAAWFHYPNGWLSDERAQAVAPKDALHRPQEVIAAARRYSGSHVA
ncbi:hypothetical protein [Paraburkholderia sp. J7]|uniref:hypothetical protein n=1 Tax=Paraburkholderia sp. J7 TaxID=2805438 RepID=UPI002AB679A2|nr:hypothetical protein [Paraburkholderia sp. J7]